MPSVCGSYESFCHKNQYTATRTPRTSKLPVHTPICVRASLSPYQHRKTNTRFKYYANANIPLTLENSSLSIPKREKNHSPKTQNKKHTRYAAHNKSQMSSMIWRGVAYSKAATTTFFQITRNERTDRTYRSNGQAWVTILWRHWSLLNMRTRLEEPPSAKVNISVQTHYNPPKNKIPSPNFFFQKTKNRSMPSQELLHFLCCALNGRCTLKSKVAPTTPLHHSRTPSTLKKRGELRFRAWKTTRFLW